MLNPLTDADPRAARRARAALILVGSLAVAVVALRHPAPHAHTVPDLIAWMRDGAAATRVIHGLAIAAALVLLIGLDGLTERLGPRALLPRAALCLYATGVLLTILAATINGFIVPALSLQADPGDAAVVGRLVPLLALCREANGALARMGVILWCAAVCAWSIALLGRPGGAHALGAIGAATSVALVGVVLPGYLPLNVHGFMVAMLTHIVWTIGAGVWLFRSPGDT